MSIYEKLSAIQSALKAPKSQYNQFGKYNYRSCEDILESVKPLLSDQKCALILSDTPELSGDWHYIKSTAKIVDTETGESAENTAYARESAVKKGMDDSQITGTASSYARKYALNGLFCIDDTKDADTDAYTNSQRQNQAQAQAQGQEQPKSYQAHLCKQCGMPIVDAVTKSGKVVPAELIYQHYGGICTDCVKKNASQKEGK